MKKVLFLAEPRHDLAAYRYFQRHYECINYHLTTAEQLINDFKTTLKDVDAIYAAWLGFIPLGGFANDILANAPPSLKIITICSVGYDGFDEHAMAEKGIVLTNVPSSGAAEPVADLVLYNAILAFRNFGMVTSVFNSSLPNSMYVRKRLDEGNFDQRAGTLSLGSGTTHSFGHYTAGRANLSPGGHTAVIVGFGRIGQTIAQRLHSVGMKIAYVKRTRLTTVHEQLLGYPVSYYRSLSEAKQVADLVVIACPGNAETKHLVNAKVIDEMARPFRIINVGRGTVIDEQALVDGLKSGKVLYAGLDVFENEPTVHPDLLDRPDVVLTPHVGASTLENFDHTAEVSLKNIDNVLNGKEPTTRVN